MDAKKAQPGNLNPKTFVKLYKLACRMTNDKLREYLPIYRDLDNLMTFIKEHPESEALKHSISRSRISIVIPYEIFTDKRRPPDGTINGKEVIYASPGSDSYVSLIIDHMDNSYMSPIHKNDLKQQTQWKLEKLSLALANWNAYVERYLKPLRSAKSYDDYVKSFISKPNK
jgi:hypothetical protein